MTKTKITIFILVIAAIAVGVFWMSEPAKLTISNDYVGQAYTDPSYGFSVEIPTGFTIDSFRNDTGGMTFLIQDSSHKDGIQALVIPINEDAVLTVDKIKNDLPDIKMRDIQEIIISEIVPAVYFKSDYASFGNESSNIWFVSNKHLYQFTASVAQDDLLKYVASSFKQS